VKSFKSPNFRYQRQRGVAVGSRQRVNWVLLVVGALLALYATWGWWTRYRVTHTPIAHVLPAAAQTVTQPIGRPDETPIKPDVAYTVPADQPRLLDMPSIHAKGFIQKVGRLPDGSMAVPTNIYLAGWYVDGPRPGEEGVAVLDGHLQGAYGPGIFAHLADAVPGQEFAIEYGDGSRRQFKVKTTTTYVLAEATKHLYDKLPNVTSQLNLITCAGTFDKSKGTFTQRVIVAAERIMKE
jgi:hypothetical protein